MTVRISPMPMRRASILGCAAALLLSLLASIAGATPSGFAFLEVPAGARASALAGAFASIADGVEAAFWNPAGLAGQQDLQISGAHYEFFEHLRHDQFAVAGRVLGGGVAASIRALYSEPITERDAFGNEIGTFGGHDLEFALGYGASLGRGLRAGATAKIVRERIANAAATTYGFDGGATWDWPSVPGIRFSLSAHNLGRDAHYRIDGLDGQAVPLPTAVQGGASVALGVPAHLTLRTALEGRFTRGRNGVAMLGAELAQARGAALRLGVRANDEASSLSLGAGYGFEALQLDYAFVPYRLELGDTHRLAFTATF